MTFFNTRKISAIPVSNNIFVPFFLTSFFWKTFHLYFVHCPSVICIFWPLFAVYFYYLLLYTIVCAIYSYLSSISLIFSAIVFFSCFTIDWYILFQWLIFYLDTLQKYFPLPYGIIFFYYSVLVLFLCVSLIIMLSVFVVLSL